MGREWKWEWWVKGGRRELRVKGRKGRTRVDGTLNREKSASYT
jgi:hypothetical protein